MFVYLILFVFLYIILDVSYLLRLLYVVVTSIIRRQFKKLHVLDECVMEGMVLTTDLDAMFHMNNARYLRECDLGQTKLWLETGVVRTIGQRFAVTNAATSIRFRKSMKLFDRFKLVTKFIYWDEKAFYFEQQFLRQPDNFVCAVSICKQATIGCTPVSMLEKVDSGLTSPPITDELKTLMESWRLSSDRLKKAE